MKPVDYIGLSNSHGRIVRHSELAVSHIPIGSERHRCCRSLCPYRRPPHPAFASFWAYDPQYDIEGSNFGKEFLRMAGIAKMLHTIKPPYGAQSYIVICKPNPNSTSTVGP